MNAQPLPKSDTERDQLLPRLPSVAVIVLNWNGGTDTLECLASVFAIDYPEFMVIVVDNGSSDGSPDAIRAAFPAAHLIETGANLGFAGGNNVGIRHALESGADYLLLLNNDAEIDVQALHRFVEAARAYPFVGAYSGKIYLHSDRTRIWYAGGRWDPELGRFVQLGEGCSDDGSICATPEITDYACGCAFFVSAARFREVGLLDEDFFLYFEESDWCYRAKKMGYPSFFVPTAKIWHKVSVSFGGEGSPLALYFITRNRLLWAHRHTSRRDLLHLHAQTLRALSGHFLTPLFALSRQPQAGSGCFQRWWWSLRSAIGNPRNLASLYGYRDYWLGRFGNCPPLVRELAARARSRNPQPSAQT